jgi:hypothetical protein
MERQELWCHDCQNYVQFDIDTSLNGNHVIKCPNCGHEHCRVVTDGKITETRWDSRNNNIVVGNGIMHTYMATGLTSSAASTYDTYTAGVSMANTATTVFTYGAWMNAGS